MVLRLLFGKLAMRRLLSGSRNPDPWDMLTVFPAKAMFFGAAEAFTIAGALIRMVLPMIICVAQG